MNEQMSYVVSFYSLCPLFLVVKRSGSIHSVTVRAHGEKVCSFLCVLWTFLGPPGALSSLLHCSAVRSFASALGSIKMGNSMGGVWASGNRKDKKATDDGYHTLGLFLRSKLHHNQKVRIWEFTRLRINPNIPKDCTGDESHINSFLAIQFVLSLSPQRFFSFYYFNC